MSNKLPEVKYADRICNLLKGDDEYSDMTEEEIIAAEEEREPEEEEPEEDHRWMHTHDGGGSFVFTGLGSGINPHESTLTRFTEKRKPR